MAKLESIIGEILKSVTQAGHETNEYVKNLAITYKNDPLLKVFPMPRAELKTVEVNLRFAFNPSDYSRKILSGETIRNAIKIILEKIEGLAKIKPSDDLQDELGLLIRESIDSFEKANGIDRLEEQIAISVKNFIKENGADKVLNEGDLPNGLRIAIKKALLGIRDEIYLLKSAANTSEMDVELSSDKLQHMVTSEIKFVTAIEKHFWKTKEGKETNPLITNSPSRGSGDSDNDFLV